jgi:putative endonuclease
MKEDPQSAYSLGRCGEEAALRYLERKKFRIVAQRFRLYRGEIDIIAYDKDTLVFVEVKTRRSREFYSPEESVTPTKQKQIKKIALGFLALHKIMEAECRFDVLSLVRADKGEYIIQHFKNAF